MLIRGARIVPLPHVPGSPAGRPAPEGVVDVRLDGGRVAEIGTGLAGGGEVLDAEGGWLMPGLWDWHVHMGQWGQTLGRIDLNGTSSPDEALARVAAALPGAAPGAVWGAGYRLVSWDRSPTVAELDAITGERPVILVGGDYHNAWLNSAALRLAGMGPREGILEEREWFEASSRIQELTTTAEAEEEGVREAARRASAMGVTGIRDFDFAPSFRAWPRRVAGGLTSLRVVTSCWPDTFGQAAGLRTGDVLDEAGLITMGPLKVVTDGSLGTYTAYMAQPYGDPPTRGTFNYPVEVLQDLVTRATAQGLEVALHAIGDQAITHVLDVIETAGARGTVEHVQVLGDGQAQRMARLGIAGSVQPAHLLDDRDAAIRVWPRDHHRLYDFATLLHAGVPLLLGSDAPVSPLDPWLAIAAAVHRSADEREPWNAAESLTAGEALACSTGGEGTLGVGSRADLALLDADPYAGGTPDTAELGAVLRSMTVRATLVDGRVVHS